MSEQVRVIKGPIPPVESQRLWESNIFRPVYAIYLDSGMIVTNPDQFPPEEVFEERREGKL